MALGPEAVGEVQRQRFIDAVAYYEKSIDNFIKDQVATPFTIDMSDIDGRDADPRIWDEHLRPLYEKAGWVFGPSWERNWPRVTFGLPGQSE